ncbi:MAG TPA: FGGY-family carbohydrate kinase, partial [Chloroflexia bacterium]|nr:FGGY-family carbohydrate kinase [Chloroflexia bacterium]
PAGSEGLLFLPYLSGERTPHPDPLARGAWVGLTLRHRRAHLTRALLEGVAFGLRDSFTLIGAAQPGGVDQVRVAGGGAQSPLWRGILASVLGVPLVRVNTTEGGAFGAALLAGVAAGTWPDVPAACAATIRLGESTRPDGDDRVVYEELYASYRALYPALAPGFHQQAGGSSP